MTPLPTLSDGYTVTPSLCTLHHGPARDMGSAASPAPCLSDGEGSGSRREGVTTFPTIENETAADAAARDALLDRVMGPRWKKKSSHRLRRGRRPAEGLAFVARDESGRVVGTVRLWDVAAGNAGAALLLGPLAVDPAYKSAGIGSALMRHAIAEAGRLGHRAILLVGDAAYYGRFGFAAEKTDKLAMPGPYEKHRFLALELADGALDGAEGVLRPTGRKAEPAERRMVHRARRMAA